MKETNGGWLKWVTGKVRGGEGHSALNLITRVRDGYLNGRRGCGPGKACPNHFDFQVDNSISAETLGRYSL